MYNGVHCHVTLYNCNRSGLALGVIKDILAVVKHLSIRALAIIMLIF